MTLWDKEQDDGSGKPNWLSEDEKARCYCDDRGWVLVHLNGTEEVLVAGGGLNNTTGAPVDSTQKAAAENAKTVSLSDPDGDGVPTYQDPDPADPNVP